MRGHPPISPLKGQSSSQLTPSSSLNQLPISPSPPGQQTAHSNKLHLKVLLTQDVFVAGMTVNGMLEVGVSSDKLALGELAIELAAFEELRSLDFTNTRRLYSKSITFQSATTPPSNAVVPGAILTPSGFYPALRGRTRFAFSFHLPADLPSSCHLGGNALVRYELVGRASSMLDQVVDMKTRKVEVKVVEKWDDWSGPLGGGNADFHDPDRLPKWLQGGERKGSGQLKLAGDGRLEVVARIGMGDVDPALTQGPKRVGRLFWTGLSAQENGNAEIDVVVKVKNASKRTVSGLKLSIARRLRILSQGQGKAKPSPSAPQITSIISSDRFQGIGYAFPAGETRIVVATIQVPTDDECWTVRKGGLFELDMLVRVEVECGFLSKDLVVEIPIWIAHPRSLPAAAHEQHQHRLIHPHSPAFPLDPPAFPRSQSEQSLGVSYTYPFAPNEFGGVVARSRTPDTHVSSHSGYTTSTTGYGSGSIASSVSSPAIFRHAQQNVYFAPPPPSPPPLSPAYWAPPPTHQPPPFHPLSPSPTFVSSPYSYAAPAPASNGYIAFDASQPDFTRSALLAQSSTFATHLATQLPQHTHISPEVAMIYSSGSSAVSSASSASFPPPPTGPPRASESLELSRSHSQPNLKLDLARHSPLPPAKLPTPSELSARKPPSRPPSAQARAAPPPPPPAPSSRFHTPSPSTSPAPSQWSSLPISSFSHSSDTINIEAFLLDTIGEDGESQAGTAKSLAALSSSFGSPTASSPGRLSMSVQDLEDFVDDREALKKWEETEGPKTPDLDKTLPPVPMPKVKETAKPPRAQDIFREQEVERTTFEMPATTSPIKRAMSPRQKPGLSALEARLLRPATPELSSKPSRSQSLPFFDTIRKPVNGTSVSEGRTSSRPECKEPDASVPREHTTLDISRFARSSSTLSVLTEASLPSAPSIKRSDRVCSPRSPARVPDRHHTPPIIDARLPLIEPTMSELLMSERDSSTNLSPHSKSSTRPIKVSRDSERDEIAAADLGMRSARGGKGGQVTSVANIWAQMTQESPTPPIRPGPIKQSSFPTSAPLALRSLSNERQIQGFPRPRTSSSPSKQPPSFGSTSLPPLALKRWSAPAPAKTFLNTTSSSAAVKLDSLPEKGVSPGIARLIQKYSS